ncbi:MAG: YabP/YqfC family sporulation protein [Bacillota bacterium]|nr:YabP/YqfC family sporulation protein [Bacillota bacterium]
MRKKHKPQKQPGLRALSQALELPPEVALGSLCLKLQGRELLTAQNHRGIILYQPERILFRCKDGAVAVSGRELSLAELSEEELCISGKIKGIALRGDQDD